MKRKEDWRGIPIPMNKGQIIVSVICALVITVGIVIAGAWGGR